jgi:hypothetical protein
LKIQQPMSAEVRNSALSLHPWYRFQFPLRICWKGRLSAGATDGEIKEVTYWWPRPGSDKPLEKTTFYTKVGDQICSVGYYKD